MAFSVGKTSVVSKFAVEGSYGVNLASGLTRFMCHLEGMGQWHGLKVGSSGLAASKV